MVNVFFVFNVHGSWKGQLFYTILFMCFQYIKCVLVDSPSFKRDGDVVIAGMFPLHYTSERPDGYSLLEEPNQAICERYNFLGFRWMQAMIFAIEEVNNSSKLLPGLDLGFQIYDTCDTLSRVVSQSISVTVKEIDNGMKRPVALVGATSSGNSIAAATIFGINDITQISYGSTTSELSRKDLYNSFLRTIPSDDEQAVAMVDLLLYFNWTWVGAIAGNDEYGRSGMSKFLDTAKHNGICIEFVKFIGKTTDKDEIGLIADEVRDFNATAFVVFSSYTDFSGLARELKRKSVSGKVWIASEAWATSEKTLLAGGEVLHGTLGIATRSSRIEHYRNFLENVSPFTQTNNPFIKEFWEESFQCSCPESVCEISHYHNSSVELHSRSKNGNLCTGKEDLKNAINPNSSTYLGWTDDSLEKSYTTYVALYALVYALHEIQTCEEGHGLLKDGKCPDIKNLQPWQLLLYTKQVSFKLYGEEEPFEFDKNGDPNATYKLVSWTPDTDGKVRFKTIGNYSKQRNPRWMLSIENIYWAPELPISVCSIPCKPGFYKIKLASACCYMCKMCPEGQFSTKVNQPQCTDCNNTHMSNDDRTGCIPKKEEYMRWSDPLGVVLVCVSCIGILLTLFAAGIFILHWDTPVVKATNREISMFLFVAIACCFITPFIYIARPENWSCRARQVTFMLSFTACISAILVKTLRVITVFDSLKMIKQRKINAYLKEHKQILIVFLLSFAQFALCVVWLVVAPPYVTRDYTKAHTVIVDCHMGSLGMVISVHVYLVILALVSFGMAFRARKLPENFNEAKFITFAMLIFFIVWLSFIPAYLSTKGSMGTACYSIAILASTFGILICLYFPKIYVMIFTPSRNTTENVRMNTANHAFRSATRSIQYRMKIDSDSRATSNQQMSGIGSSVASDSPMFQINRTNTPILSKKQRHMNGGHRRRKIPANSSIRQNKSKYTGQYIPKYASSTVTQSPDELKIQIDHEVKTTDINQVEAGSEDEESTLRSSASFDLTLRVNVLTAKRKRLQRCMSEASPLENINNQQKLVKFASSSPNLSIEYLQSPRGSLRAIAEKRRKRE